MTFKPELTTQDLVWLCEIEPARRLEDETWVGGSGDLGIVDIGPGVLGQHRIKTHLSDDSLAHVSHFHLPYGSGDNESCYPKGICSDGTHYYIVDNGNHRIKKHRISDGLFIWAVGTLGTGDDQFDHPFDICTDGTYLYITDHDNWRIKKHLCSTGAYVAQVGGYGVGLDQFITPSGICTDGTYLYNTEGSPGSAPLIKKRLCSTLAGVSQISADGHLNSTNCQGICTDGLTLFLTNCNSGAAAPIFQYTLALVYISEYGTNGTGDTQFIYPYGICTDNTHLYIVDNGNDRIKKHRISDYGFVSKIGTSGNGDDQFTGPIGICIHGTSAAYYVSHPEGKPSRVRECMRTFISGGAPVGTITTYAEQTSFSDCQNTPSSWWWDAANFRLYVRTSTGDDPSTPGMFLINSYFWERIADRPVDLQIDPTSGNPDWHPYRPLLDPSSIGDLSFEATQFSTGGISQSFGSVTVLNEDRYWDSRLADYVYEGKRLVIRFGHYGDTYAEYIKACDGYTGGTTWTDGAVVFDSEDPRRFQE
jgi:hypothetical protein